MKKPTIVIALGGNALLRRGQIMSYQNQLENIRIAADAIGKLTKEYRIAIVHGNGPQVGLLAQQNEAYSAVPAYPLSCLVAETQGMIATMLVQELQKICDKPITSILTHVEVDPNDLAFIEPTKFIGAVYDQTQAETLAKKYHWQIKADGNFYRRVVASPKPLAVRESSAIRTALDNDNIVICAGGGGIPVAKQDGIFTNIDCVIDKDATASLLATQIKADYFLILTDGDGIYLNWGKENQTKLTKITASELATYQFDPGSMQPKVNAVINFVQQTPDGKAIITDLNLANQALKGKSGTLIIN
ncbi:carbamate kinase [Mergibacter septicus]|uniref:Carbamate kinase n=1 Tax=Mergibacter septicus TaxID=221402 RepID=A0A8D4IY13_9PAST|nr:carbamate kinase [Mergibacter septicus]AWX15446.1 carbamate kinase [Mergibacter septicus]QDJ14699.1 carbamate kinase [Mergibacter septicus]UTU47872.1 carbamate kinase [Mergibacter septicus]WMR96521.1 carbamate kinase [Mergibacter septicus]